MYPVCLRYMDAKDPVLVMRGEADQLVDLVLGCGRMYSAFVADSTKVDEVRERVSSACAAAVKRGLFVGTEEVPVVVGPDVLPVHVPKHNVGATTSTHLAELVEGDSNSEVPLETHQRAVTNKSAAVFGLEIKVSIICVGPDCLESYVFKDNVFAFFCATAVGLVARHLPHGYIVRLACSI